MISTDIIIISYKDKEELKRLITSIELNCSDYNLIIEDNNITNRFFTRAVNDGISKGSAPFIWLINSDAIILEGAQEHLINRFSYAPRVGIVGSMQIDYDNKDCIRHGGTLQAFPYGIHDGGLISMGHCQIPKKQKWVNYASVMFRRMMVNNIGSLDNSMVLLYSDSDYCYYARSKGWEVWYEPRSCVYHKLKASKNITEWHEKDMKAFMIKWGITYNPETKSFQYSEKFRNLDMFP